MRVIGLPAGVDGNTATYNANGQVATLQQKPTGNPAGNTTTCTRDDAGRLASAALARNGTTVSTTTYGWSVTGSSFRTGMPFDVGRVSDYDVVLAGEDIFGAARGAGIGLRSGGSRTGPLSAVDFEQLGLTGLRADLSGLAGRDVNFMIFRNLEDAFARGPSIGVPGP